ncbi:MAG: hypothetical protein HJJLKODD_00536 [Phycisphaerae bacterium]|nr:hypothetical protein [Phycisphaerae bacterium]
MKYERFEQLPVWRDAQQLALRIYQVTEEAAFRTAGDLISQLRRAALSVSNNIAEGFERGSTADLLTFLYIARGSAGEVRSLLCFCEQWSRTQSFKSQISDLKSLAEGCSRQIRAWADALQNSDIKGQRHLTDNSRSVFEHKRNAAIFWDRIDQLHREYQNDGNQLPT